MSAHSPGSSDDPFDLARFLTAQAPCYDTALNELRQGRKESHWMWFIFPQLAGLGRSTMAERFAIRSLAEARAYWKHPVLGARLAECCGALLTHPDRSARAILGFPDDLKLRSSMTLFERVAGRPELFGAVLQRYFEGERDELTLALLRQLGDSV